MANPDYGQNFNPNKDINRYLSQQGRAPQSHFDWETWRKIGQPGAYQAPPGGSTVFRGVRGGAGGPNYNANTNNYNMFASAGDTIATALAGPTSWLQGKFAKMGAGKDTGDSASSGSGSDMADGANVVSGGSAGSTNRSQNASITSPSTSRGMRRSRGGDFNSTLAQHNITMVQGNDNYGTVHGNMGGANVGGGSYDNSFQSKNTGGTQTAFSNVSGGTTPSTGGFPPPTPTPPPPPPTGGTTPPSGGNTPPPVAGGGTPPTAIGTPPPSRGGIVNIDYGIKNPTLTPQNAGGSQTPTGQGPSTYGNTEGVKGTQETKDLQRLDRVTSLATGGATDGERDAAGTALNRSGIQSNTNPANQRGAGDTAPPMLAGYENMSEPAPQQGTRFGDMGMGVPANAAGGGMPAQYNRMQGAVPSQYQAMGRTYGQSSTTVGNLNPSPFSGPSANMPPQYGAMQGAVRANPAAYAPKLAGQQSAEPVAAPAKKTGGRKAATPKTTSGPTSVASKKAPAKGKGKK